MREPKKPKDLPATKAIASPRAKQMSPDDSFDDEEKLLSGHHDVNMPALLTRDVKGG